jgi:hypothetical protein
MAAMNINSIRLEAFSFEDFTFTRFITGTVDASCIGKAVTNDPTVPGAVKLAGEGDPVYGRIYTYEDRAQESVKVVGCERKFIKRLPKSAAAIALGDHVVGTLVGGVGGFVKTGTPSATDPRNHVLFVGSDYVIVEKL